MTANDSKSYFTYLNKWVDEYNNSYHHSVDKKPTNVNYSALSENIKSNPKAPKLELNDTVRITKYRNIFSKGYAESWSRKIFTVDSVLKINPWTYKIKDLNGENLIGSFNEKKLIGSIL